MGWTERRAEHYKNGDIDRKAELIDEFTCHTDKAEWEVLKCSMKGSVGYMAIKYTNKEDSTKNKVYACVCLTSVRDGYWFGYKDMDECMNPYQYDCPKSILNLLSPTDNEWALEWRRICIENNDKNSMKNQLFKAKVGSKIKVTYNYDTNLAKKGEEVILKKDFYYTYCRIKYQWITTSGTLYRVPPKMILANNPEWIEFIK